MLRRSLIRLPFSRAIRAFCIEDTASVEQVKLPNEALTANIAKLEIRYKTLEERNARNATLSLNTQQSWANLIMDYDAFNRMSLAEQAPVSSIIDIDAPAQTPTPSTGNSQHVSIKHLKRQLNVQRKAIKRERKAIQAEKERIEKKLSVLRASHLEALDDDDDDGGVPLFSSIAGPKTTDKISVGPFEAELTAPLDESVAVEGTNCQRPAWSRPKRNLSVTSVGLNPSVPSYEPLSTAPVGAASVMPHEQSKLQNPFTMYQPMQSVPIHCILPSWRIDKLHRYRSMATLRDTYKAPMPAPLVPTGRRPGSPPRSAPFSTANVIQRNSNKGAEDGLSKGHEPYISKSLAPEPTASYLAQSSRPTQKLLLPQTLLTVLDLNGTLLHRTKGRRIYPRPNLVKFLKYCLTNHSVCIWSSARPSNVELMCSMIFEPYQRALLLAEWGRDTLGLSKEDYNEKVQVYKRLDVIWNNTNFQRKHPHYQAGERWSQANTVLIDDSMLKAVAQPYNHIEIPEYKGNWTNSGEEGDDMVLGQVVAYLEEARMWKDVSSFIRHEKFMIRGGWDWDWKHGRTMTPDSRENA